MEPSAKFSRSWDMRTYLETGLGANEFILKSHGDDLRLQTLRQMEGVASNPQRLGLESPLSQANQPFRMAEES